MSICRGKSHNLEGGMSICRGKSHNLEGGMSICDTKLAQALSLCGCVCQFVTLQRGGVPICDTKLAVQ